jgi:hypothetical protein
MWCLLFYSCTSFCTDFLFWWGIKISYLTRYESAIGIPDSAHNWKSVLRFLSWWEVMAVWLGSKPIQRILNNFKNLKIRQKLIVTRVQRIALWWHCVNENVTDTILWQGHHDRVMQLNWLYFCGICQMTLTCYVHYKVICNGLAHRVENLSDHRRLHHVDLD